MADSEKQTRPCVICEKAYDVYFVRGDGWVTCADGVVCEATGNYGSSVFDPLNGGEVIQFLICDECLKKRYKYFTLFKVSRPRTEVTRTKKNFADYLDQDLDAARDRC